MGELPIYSVSERGLYAGAHPLWILERLIDSGIESFIDLTEPQELYDRSASSRAYAPALSEMAQQRGLSLAHHSFPIEDFGVPTPELLDATLSQIDRDLADGRPVYVHCWGGYGRTGIVVGAWLIRHHLADPAGFVQTIAKLRKHLPTHFTSPVTAEQIEFVRSYVTRPLAPSQDLE